MTRFGYMVLLLLCACGQQPAQDPKAEAPPRPGAAQAKAAGAGLPDYLPDYPGSTRVEVPYLGAGPDRRSGNAIAMETDDGPAEVAIFYRARLAEAGVPVRVDSTGPAGGVMGVGRDGERGAMLTISAVGGKTRIAVMRSGGR